MLSKQSNLTFEMYLEFKFIRIHRMNIATHVVEGRLNGLLFFTLNKMKIYCLCSSLVVTLFFTALCHMGNVDWFDFQNLSEKIAI